MKENFIELTEGDHKVLINLQNVTQIVRYGKDKYTTIFFNSPQGAGLFMTPVEETYEEIKKLIGLVKKEVKVYK